jgi:enoyl-CoA hydratase
LAIQATKESVMTGLGLSLEEAYKFESKIAGQVFQTEDAKEGPKAFAEKRPPVWKSK